MKKNKAYQKLKNWSSKSDKCPICHKHFKTGCNHSVVEAKERLRENYIKSLVK